MILVDRIRASGPIPFEEFHAAALYDPNFGFFTTGPLRSAREGDFLTSPEVSPLFGSALAAFVRRERERLGDPPDFVVVDAGAGSGSLLRPLLAAESVEAWAIDVSPAARAALVSVLPEERVLSSFGGLPESVTGVLIANELLDNLPVAVAVRTATGWEERWVAASSEGLELVAVPVRREVEEWCRSFGGPVAEGGWVEVQLAAAEWTRAALARLAAGALVVVDYGDTAEGLGPRRAHGTVRTYRSHHLGPDPLDSPGSVDITVDVNFSALEAVARDEGCRVELLRQEDFLTGLGLREALRDLRYRELELARSGAEVERLVVRSERVGAETLLHPRGLGDFRVLVARREPPDTVTTSDH